MAEGSSTGSRRHNRANWVALRTLRQLPKVVGETSAGEPIVEIRSVRLVLRTGAAHFSRVTTCSKCGREVPGAPVLSPGDLDHPPHPVICKDCVRTASAPVVSAARRPVEAVADAGRGADGAPLGDDQRLAALERQVAELAELVKGQRADLEAALEARMNETRVEVRSIATKELARAQEDVDRMMKGVVERVGRTAGVDAGGVQAVEGRLAPSIERLSQRVDDQRAELVADVEARLAQLQASVEDQAGRAVEQVEAMTTELAGTQDELRRRVDAVAEPVDSAPMDTIEARLAEVQSGVRADAERIEAQLTERFEALEAQVGQLQASAVSQSGRLEAELNERLDRVAADSASGLYGLEAGLRELQAMVEDQLLTQWETAAADAERLKALDEHLRQLDARVHRSHADTARIEAQLGERLDRQAERLARAAADRSRLDVFEQQLDEAVGRFAALVESQRLELEEEVRNGLAEVRAAVAVVESDTTGRLKNAEAAAAEGAAQLAEVVELQATLDTGLGELRSQIEQIRETAARSARSDSRLQPLVDVPQLPPVEPERGRRPGRKSADAIAGLSAAVQGLITEHRQLRAEVLTLQNETETAVRASARASAQATPVGPLRQDVRALREEVATQNQTVAALAKTVETLRRAVQPKPAAKRAAKAAPATPSAKARKAALPLPPRPAKAGGPVKAAHQTKAGKPTKASKVTKATKKA